PRLASGARTGFRARLPRTSDSLLPSLPLGGVRLPAERQFRDFPAARPPSQPPAASKGKAAGSRRAGARSTISPSGGISETIIVLCSKEDRNAGRGGADARTKARRRRRRRLREWVVGRGGKGGGPEEGSSSGCAAPDVGCSRCCRRRSRRYRRHRGRCSVSWPLTHFSCRWGLSWGARIRTERAGARLGRPGLRSLSFSLWPDGFVWTILSICNFIKVTLYNPDQDGSDSPRSSLNNSLSDQSLASVNLNSVGSVHSYTPVTNHPEPVSQSLTPQQQPQPQYSIPERDKQLLFSEYNFEDLSASFRSLYKSVFEQSLSQQGLMSIPSESSQPPHTSCSYQHSPSNTVSSHQHSGQSSLSNSHSSGLGATANNSVAQVSLSHPQMHTQPSPHPPHRPHGLSQHPQRPQHPAPHPQQHSQLQSPHPQHPSPHQHIQHHQNHQHQSLAHQTHPPPQQVSCNSGVSTDWYATLDMLKESCRIASSVNWSDVDLSQFQGLMESMRQADLKNWSLDQVQFADLCSSLNQFFTQTGLIHSQSNVQQSVCHNAMHPTKPSQHIGTGNLYIDSRQNLPPSVMPPPGYPHIPQSLSTPGSTIAGHHGAMSQQHMMPSSAFQMRRALPPDDIQDDFDWDSIV
uniref:Forkhead box J3 n=1 Tax=Sarcophilus harrisii TaxID=9305 RepID=A0A7N4PAE9_SARHA